MVKTVNYSHTNSYETLNSLTNETRNIWVCFHGLGYLSKFFAKYFKSFSATDNYIIVLQAPAKFYLDKNFKNVGASWLTRVDTMREMENNRRYIDKVLHQEGIHNDPRLIFFGYSQGVSIATRYLSQHEERVKALIMHSGSIPNELDENTKKHYFKVCEQFFHISGTFDEYATPEKEKEELKKIEMLFGDRCQIYRPDIKHVVHVPLLEEIAQKLA